MSFLLFFDWSRFIPDLIIIIISNTVLVLILWWLLSRVRKDKEFKVARHALDAIHEGLSKNDPLMAFYQLYLLSDDEVRSLEKLLRMIKMIAARKNEIQLQNEKFTLVLHEKDYSVYQYVEGLKGTLIYLSKRPTLHLEVLKAFLAYLEERGKISDSSLRKGKIHEKSKK